MLSIIIPALNEEKYLPFFLKSIKNQNFKDFEIILADAGSIDGTKKIAEDFGCKVVPGGLPAKGRNEGAKAAKGNLFLFMDADNLILKKDFLNELLSEFKKRKLAVASFPIYPDGKKVGPFKKNNKIWDKISFFISRGADKFFYKIYNNFVYLTQIPYATNSVLVKKEIFEKVKGGFDEEVKIGEDHWFAKQAAKFGKFGFIKIGPLLTSSRRYEKDGRFKTYLKYIFVGIYMLFFGPFKKSIFEYFDDLRKKQ